ncbi:hypothetical protein D3C72_1509530 [compost metagenome]
MHQAGNADLVDHLGQLARAAFAQVGAGTREGHGHRLDGVEHRFIPAAHHRELAIDGARLPAGDGRVDELQAQCLGLGVEFTGHIRRCRGVVHKDRSALHAGKGAILAGGDRAQVIVIAHAAEHDVGTGGCLARRGRVGRGLAGGKFGHPSLGFFGGAVVHGDLVARLGEMGSHRVAHDAQADEGHFQRGSRIVGTRLDTAGHGIS